MHEVMISAHRCRSNNIKEKENKARTVIESLEYSYDFIEFDVQMTKDHHFILHHDDQFTNSNGDKTPIRNMTLEQCEESISELLTYESMLHLIKGRSKAHIDFKFTSPHSLYSTPEKTYESIATRIALDIMGVENIIITTLEDESVRAVRDTFKESYPELYVGLSLGRSVSYETLVKRIRIRFSEFFPLKRLRKCDANLIVINKKIYGPTIRRAAKILSSHILIWTVDKPKEQRKYLKDKHIWLMTTNFPQNAQKINNELLKAKRNNDLV